MKIFSSTRIICFLAILLLLILILISIFDFLNLPSSFDTVELNESRKTILNFKMDSNSELAYLTAILLGFLWITFVIEKKKFSEIIIRTPLEIFLFTISNIFYGFSIASYYFWKDRLISAYWGVSISSNKDTLIIPNFLSDYINFFSDKQFLFFLFGIFLTVFLIIYIKRKTN